jgi:hypothetical protein
MNTQPIRRRTGHSRSSRLVILMVAIALVLSIVPLFSNSAAAQDTNPRPPRPTQTSNLAFIPPVGTAEPTGPGGLVVNPVIPPIEIDDFTAETPEPTEEIDDFVAATPEPTEEITDLVEVDPEPAIGHIELNKWECPDGFEGTDWANYLENCTETMNGIEFNATLNDTSLGTKYTGENGDGTITWDVEGEGDLMIQETIPAGYLDPIVYCGFTFTFETEAGEAIADGLIFPDSMVGGVLMHEFSQGEMLYCDVFNRPSTEPGSVRIVKHTCAPGYDVNAPTANPWLDCPEITNGVTFTLQGFEYWAQSTTGDVTDGQVYFGGLIPGMYGAFETLPADTWYAFAYECVGDVDGGLAPTLLVELENGNTLYIDVQPGVNYTCHFMNVPNLHGGTVMLTKYWCDGAVYNIWSCDLYEHGASFNFYGGAGPIQVTTGADGQAVLFLDPGSYELDEVTYTWCFAEASNVDWQGNIVVADGETTYVNIFNCGERPHKTPETPGKFPNTGVKP